MLALLILLACGDSTEQRISAPGADQAGVGEQGVVLSDRPPAQQECIATRCDSAAASTTLDACIDTHCAETLPSYSVLPQRIAYEEGMLFAEVTLAHSPGSFGDVAVPRSKEIHLGVTVVTESGEEIDLAVQTLFPERLEDSFLFSAEVGLEVRDVIIGAWDEKIEPCAVDRYGCREFGFVLDGPLASWPPDFYVHGHRQRIPPAKLVVAVSGDLPPERRAALEALVGPFSTTLDWSGKAEPVPGVRYRNTHDWVLARSLSGDEEPVKQDDLPVDISVSVPQQP